MNGLLGNFLDDIDDPRKQGLLGFALATLAGAGPSTQRRSTGQILGASGLAGMQAHAGRKRAQLLENEDRRRDEEMRMLQPVRQAQAAKLLAQLQSGQDPDEPKEVTTAKWFMSLPPEQQLQVLQYRRGDDQIVLVNGVPTRVSKSGMRDQSPLSTLGSEAESKATIASAEETARQSVRGAWTPEKIWNPQAGREETVSRSQLLPNAPRFRQQGGTAIPSADLAGLPPALRFALGPVLIPSAGGVPAGQSTDEKIDEARRREEELQRARNEADREKAAPKTIHSLQRAIDRADEVVIPSLQDAAKLTNWKSTGLGGTVFEPFRGTDFANLKEKIGNAVSNVGFSELQNMRFESPTGGALGQVAVQELEMLQKTLGSLSQNQDPDQLKKQISLVESQYRRTVDRMRQAIKAENDFLARRGSPSRSQQSGNRRLKFNPETGELE